MASMARNANMVSLKYEQKVAIHTSIPIFSWFRTFLVWWSMQQIPPEKWEDFKNPYKMRIIGFCYPFLSFLQAVMPFGHFAGKY